MAAAGPLVPTDGLWTSAHRFAVGDSDGSPGSTEFELSDAGFRSARLHTHDDADFFTLRIELSDGLVQLQDLL